MQFVSIGNRNPFLADLNNEQTARAAGKFAPVADIKRRVIGRRNPPDRNQVACLETFALNFCHLLLIGIALA
jgi:hypothetical protein